MLTFQEIIARLERHWAEQGCLVWYPYHETVGAGTANPATTLRVLGPEPWKVAYLEPSFRPDDGRYGDNPNRLQMHHQFQVILKPIPYDPQDLYLESLYALGIDRRRNDLRFVEDNWESPALGAWGLGWEVWLNGLEISQYTYFQQAGGRTLDPPALELTYGLERIAMALCDVPSVWEIPWNDRLTYGDILHRQEVEHCVYDFEVAGVERLRRLFDIAVEEAESCLGRGLVIPAHDQVLRCSHTFNLLDSRAAVGVTERAAYFGKMRALSRRVAQAYLEQREETGHPLLSGMPGGPALEPASMPEPADEPLDLLLEVGCEELPPDDLDSCLAFLDETFGARLDEARLAHGEVRVRGTPRRLVVEVASVAPRQDDLVETVKGPPVRVAKDGDGNWTKAALGFGRKLGLAPDAFRVETRKGAEYLVAERKTEGRAAAAVLAGLLPDVIRALPVKKSMSWLCTACDGEEAASIRFSRPVRWIVALLGEDVIPFTFASIASGRVTYGMRQDGTPAFAVSSAGEYAEALAPSGIVVDPQERGRAIREGAVALASGEGGTVDPDDLDPCGLLGEVRQMVEKPTPFLGRFDPDHLEVPAPVLVTVMREHQRYFPVRDEAGGLLPCFVGVRNGGCEHLDSVRAGNEAVIRARFADARYFFDQDRAQDLESWLPRLETLMFQESLGSFRDKTTRLEALVHEVAELAGLCSTDAERETLRRATHLCKADMVTRVVTEFPYLAGTMGAVYARLQGESEEVARAIEEQYRPAPGRSDPPSTGPALALALADRLDKLAGLFGLGLRPSGTADPYALRRDALGLIVALLETGTSLSVREGLRRAAAHLPVSVEAERLEEAAQFVERRLQVLLAERCERPDLVAAAVAGSGDDPVLCRRSLGALEAQASRDDWDRVLTAYARCARLARSESACADGLDRRVLTDPAEVALAERVVVARERCAAERSAEFAFEAVAGLAEEIHAFFDAVMVMADDPALRRSRLGLLASIDGLLAPFADLSKVEGF